MSDGDLPYPARCRRARLASDPGDGTLRKERAVDNTFDWFVGTWSSQQRRLREVLAGSQEWYEFPGTHRV